MCSTHTTTTKINTEETNTTQRCRRLLGSAGDLVAYTGHNVQLREANQVEFNRVVMTCRKDGTSLFSTMDSARGHEPRNVGSSPAGETI